ncbi:MAG: bifunctional glutamate N-acetyltransferase/amino-acid acetyltransferase ArgJ [Acidimicrobiia bacterium]|nr:bifunctional glutamate N-acetyltransferase/amino-acid acetyltransferase ArgJ [Acidimicrobiia bacterium]
MNAITAPAGFVAAGIHAGLKRSGKLDLSFVGSENGQPLSAAGVFTSNNLAAAPVQVSRSHLSLTAGRAAAVIANSGNANAATGATGYQHAEEMCRLTAEEFHCSPHEVLVCSTGLIGIPMPMEVLEVGVPKVVAARSSSGGSDAAAGIMTTDSVRKEVVWQGSTFTIGAMAKGAGMLQPNMATMLAFLTTDAAIEPPDLQTTLSHAVVGSFNSLTVDGAQSTNDTVLALASGVAGPADPDELRHAFDAVCYDLALQMADDAEGSTKTVIVRVQGATSDEEALHAGRAVANNQLVKCSWYGKNAYWGRVAAEVGASGIGFDADLLTISYGEVVTARNGMAVPFDEVKVAEHFEGRRVSITVDLGLGNGVGEVITTDLSHAYVDENMGKS